MGKHYPHLTHISSGDELRAEIKSGSEVGKKISTYMQQGLLVPVELVMSPVVKAVASAKGRVVLDGCPRAAEEPPILTANGVEPAIVIMIEVPEDVSRDRFRG